MKAVVIRQFGPPEVGSEFPADRDLLAVLLGPPVTASVLPALGRQEPSL